MLQPTDEQQAVIQHDKGHALVCAVPGSGKTATLINRVQYLLNTGVPAEKILVLMFNRQASQEFKSRLDFTLSFAESPEVMTFHGLGFKALEQLSKLGHIEKRSLANNHDLMRYVRQGVAHHTRKLDRKARQLFSKADILVKKTLTQIEQGLSMPSEPLSTLLKSKLQSRLGLDQWMSFNIARSVLDALSAKGLITYRMMLTEPVRLAQEQQLVAPILRGYSHILVDEYQDINFDQIQMLRLLISEHTALMAVGDMDQCIYEWRGAQPDYMLDEHFSQEFPGYTRYALTRTFRYGASLCTAANNLIDHNLKRLPLVSTPHDDSLETQVCIVRGKRAMADEISDWYKNGVTDQSAVLYRYWADTIPLQLSLAGKGYPFRVSSKERSLFNNRPMKALSAWLHIAAEGKASLEDLISVFSFPTLMIKKETLRGLILQLLQGQSGESVAAQLDLAQQLPFAQRWSCVQQWVQIDSSEPVEPKLKSLQSTLGWAAALMDEGDTEEANEQLKEMDAVILDAAGRRRLTILQLHTELSSLANNNHNQDGLLIATIHATKGLEWDNVILDGLEASRFPRDDDKGDRLIEEERRLFYVGMTRARKRLVCVLPDSSEPSQFLAEAGLFSITPETGV